MGFSLTEIAEKLENSNKKVQLIYAFNGTGKTRLSQELKLLIDNEETEKQVEIMDSNFIYYNAFTEELFYWDNDAKGRNERKLKIYPNLFTKWILEVQGQENNIANKFKEYTSSKLTPNFNSNFSEVRFSFERGNDKVFSNVKISKGEESNFIWCVFFVLIEEIIGILEEEESLKEEPLYIFIDDPVTSLDDNHLIHLAVDLAQLIKASIKLNIKFIITTHNPLFYNVLYNEFNKLQNKFGKYLLEKLEDGTFSLKKGIKDSPFSYHIFLIKEIKNAIETGNLKKYHFNFLRNILEKTTTFLGYENYVDLLPKMSDGKPSSYDIRIINVSSHSKHSGEEMSNLSDKEKDAIKRIFNHLTSNYNFCKEV